MTDRRLDSAEEASGSFLKNPLEIFHKARHIKEIEALGGTQEEVRDAIVELGNYLKTEWRNALGKLDGERAKNAIEVRNEKRIPARAVYLRMAEISDNVRVVEVVPNINGRSEIMVLSELSPRLHIDTTFIMNSDRSALRSIDYEFTTQVPEIDAVKNFKMNMEFGPDAIIFAQSSGSRMSVANKFEAIPV